MDRSIAFGILCLVWSLNAWALPATQWRVELVLR